MDAGHQHELIGKLKELAAELGKTPTRDQFRARYGWPKAADRAYPLWASFVQAAGLEPVSRASAQKIDNSVFRRDLASHLGEYRPRSLAEPEAYKRTVFVPDTHHPFACQRTLEAIYRFIEKEQPECVVQVGDLADRYSHARFPRSHLLFSAEEEDQMARAGAETMWREIQKAAPKAECIQMVGNHDVRPLKQILSAYPQAERWIEKMMAEALTFEGVRTILDPREELKLPGNVDVIHGHYSKLGDHRNFSLTNVVHGHTHTGGVVFRNFAGKTLWELDCGYAADAESKGLSYTAQRTTKWTLGWGFLDEHGPRFIPLR